MGMKHSRELDEAADPLLVRCALPHSVEVYPYGFPARYISNSPAVIAAARTIWPGARKLYDEAPLDLRCVVSPTAAGANSPTPVFRAQRNLLTAVADQENFWSADLERGCAAAWVSANTAARTDYLRYHFLEGMACSLLDVLRVVTIHAAAVERNGCGALLSGDSGAGKSSLAYACARRGWTYCSDDASALLLHAEENVVMGNPRAFRFRASAGALFPEFRGLRESRRGGGKPTIEVALSALPEISTTQRCAVRVVAFLNRSSEYGGRATAQEVPREQALRRLLNCPWPPEVERCGAREEALRRLLGARLVELRYRDLEAAVDLLKRLTDEAPQQEYLR